MIQIRGQDTCFAGGSLVLLRYIHSCVNFRGHFFKIVIVLYFVCLVCILVGSGSKLEDENYVDDGHHGTTTVDNNHVVVDDLGLLFDYNSTLQHCHTCRCSPRRRQEKEGRTASTAPRPLKRKWTLLQCCLCAGHDKKYDDVLNKSYCTNDSDFTKKISYNSTSDITEKVMMASSEQDSSTTRKSRWLGGNAPSVSKNPFKRERAASSDPKGLLSADSSIEKSLSSTSVQGNNEKSLKKSISSTSLGKTLKRAASKLSLSSSREKSGSSMSVKTTQTDFLGEVFFKKKKELSNHVFALYFFDKVF